MNIGDLIFMLFADGSKLEKSVTDQATAAADAAGGKAGARLGQRMSSGLAKGMTAVGAAAGTMFVGAVEAGAQFEDQLRTINTVAKLSDEQLAEVGDGIQALSRETGKTTDDLTAGFYDLVSAGVPVDKAMASLKASAVLATGALGTTNEAVDLVTSALGAYNLDASESTKVTDIFAQAVADGKTTVADLAGGISQVAPIAAAAGVSLEEVAAATAVMTLKGDTASQAMTRIKSAISALLTPNETLNKIQERTGINFAKLAEEKGLTVALEELRKATKGNNEEFGKAVGSSEALVFAFATTGDNAAAMAGELDKVTVAGEEGGVALGQYTEKSKSSVEQGKRFAAVLNTLAQDFGGAASTAAPFLMTLNALAPSMRGLLSPAKILGGALGALGGRAAGGLLGGLRRIPLGPFRSVGAKVAAAIGAGIVGKAGEGVIVDSIADSVSGSVGGGKLKAATGKLGGFLGSTLGKAASVAFAAVMWFEVFETYNRIKGELAEQNAQISKDTANLLTTGNDAALAQAKAALEKGLTDINGVWDAGIFTTDSRKKLEADLAAVNAEIERRAAEMGPAAAAGIQAGTPAATAATDAMLADVEKTINAASATVGAAAHAAGVEIPQQTAEGMRSARQVVFDAIDALGEAMKHQMTPWGQASRLTGFLTGKQLAKGLHSADPAVRRQADETRAMAEERLAKIIAGSGKAGKAAGEALKKGLHSKNPEVRAAAQRVKELVDAKLAATAGPAKTAGANAGQAFSNALRRNINVPQIVMATTVRAGSNTQGKAIGGPVFAGTPYWVNENTPRSELFVPSTSGRILTHAQAIAALQGAGGGGGQSITIPVTVQGAVPVRTARDIATEVRRAGELALTPAARLAPMYPRREATTR